MSRKLELRGRIVRHIDPDFKQTLRFSGTEQGGKKHQMTKLPVVIGDFLSREVSRDSVTLYKNVRITVEVEDE